jgi:hypothetical protein
VANPTKLVTSQKKNSQGIQVGGVTQKSPIIDTDSLLDLWSSFPVIFKLAKFRSISTK